MNFTVKQMWVYIGFPSWLCDLSQVFFHLESEEYAAMFWGCGGYK